MPIDARIPLGVNQSNIGNIFASHADDLQKDKLVRSDLRTSRLQQQKLEEEAEQRRLEQRREANATSSAQIQIVEAYNEALTVSNLLKDGKKEEALKVVAHRGMKMLDAGADITDMKRLGNLIQKDIIQAGGYLHDKVIPTLKDMMNKAVVETVSNADKTTDPVSGDISIFERNTATNQIDQRVIGSVGVKPEEENDTYSSVTLPNGRVIQVNDRTNQEFTSPRNVPATSESVSNREAKIQDLMAQINPQTGVNFTRAESTNRLDNLITTGVNPVGGGVETINRLEQTVTEVGSGADPAPPPPGPEPGQGIYDQIAKGTGIASAVRAGVSIFGAQFGANVDAETLQARDALKAAINPLIESLQITDRMGSLEVQRISNMGNLEPSAFKSPGAMQAQALGLDRRLKLDLAQALAEIKNESLPDDRRQKASNDAVAIQNFLTNFDAPEVISPRLLDLESIPMFEIDDLERLKRNISQEDLDAMPEDIYRALIKRLNDGR